MVQDWGIIQEEMKELYEKHQAVITGSHFVYTPKEGQYYHGADYISKERLGRSSEVRRRVSEVISQFCFENMERKGTYIDTVTGPELEALFFLPGVSDCLSGLCGREVVAVPCEKENKDDPDTAFMFKGIYQPDIRGKKVLVIEDVLKSGGSARRVVQAVRDAGGLVVLLAALANRGNVTSQDIENTFLVSLFNVTMERFPAATCPICKEKGIGSIRTDLGKGKDFLRIIKSR